MKEKKERILIVEDDEALRAGLEENFKFGGYEVTTASDGPQALKVALEQKPDLVILDVMLPGISGYEVCRKMRDEGAQTPVIMLTARQDEFDKLHGFESGADDYVTKPFSIKELFARVRAVLARGRRKAGMAARYEFEDFVLDTESRVLTKKGAEIPLTRTEFDLLAYLCANEGKALSREAVMNDVWGMQYFGTQRSLDSFVASLRSKIEKKSGSPQHIVTVHGVGYKFLR
jgi:DNA-binding response OmpR family regulator